MISFYVDISLPSFNTVSEQKYVNQLFCVCFSVTSFILYRHSVNAVGCNEDGNPRGRNQITAAIMRMGPIKAAKFLHVTSTHICA